MATSREILCMWLPVNWIPFIKGLSPKFYLNFPYILEVEQHDDRAVEM